MGLSTKQRQGRMRLLYEFQEGICPYCKVEMMHPDECRAEGKMLELWAPSIEHVIPRCKGGGDQLENLMLVHKDCNEDRGHGKMPPYARQMRLKVLQAIAEFRQTEYCRNAPGGSDALETR